jgi:hypothetical protein
VVHLLTALCRVPVGVGLQQLHIEAVEATRRFDVKGVLPNLLDRGDARQWQEKPEVVVKVRVVAGDGFAIGQVFCLQAVTVRSGCWISEKP